MADNKEKGTAKEVSKETLAQKYKRLLQEAEDMKQEAVEALKAEIQGRIDELNEYGFAFRLTDREPTSAAKKGGTSTGASKKAKSEGESSKYNPKLKCSVCGIVGHDGRAHKTRPEKFTEEQLKQFGFMPPAGDARQQDLLPA